MPTTLPRKTAKPATGEARSGPASTLPIALLIPSVVLAALSFVLPPPLVLPASSVICLLAGLAMAAYVCLRRRLTHQVDDGDYDLSGGLVFIGFAASILTDAPEAMRALEDLAGLYAPRLSAGPLLPSPH